MVFNFTVCHFHFLNCNSNGKNKDADPFVSEILFLI
jgi:hypothetical protein